MTPRIDPVPTDVVWPELIAACQRRGIPVSRMDGNGELHLLRTAEDLRLWEKRHGPQETA